MADANRQLLTDIGLVLRDAELRPVYAVAVNRQREVSSQKKLRRIMDVGLVSGAENLGQAVMLRLLTPRGELAELAHPEYGSRLHELVGRPNTPTTRNLMKLFILESLKQEPRIEEVKKVSVEPHEFKVLRGIAGRDPAPAAPGPGGAGDEAPAGLKIERRIEESRDASGKPRVNPSQVVVTVEIKPAGAAESVTIGPFTLELTP